MKSVTTRSDAAAPKEGDLALHWLFCGGANAPRFTTAPVEGIGHPGSGVLCAWAPPPSPGNESGGDRHLPSPLCQTPDTLHSCLPCKWVLCPIARTWHSRQGIWTMPPQPGHRTGGPLGGPFCALPRNVLRAFTSGDRVDRPATDAHAPGDPTLRQLSVGQQVTNLVDYGRGNHARTPFFFSWLTAQHPVADRPRPGNRQGPPPGCGHAQISSSRSG
jgi:hypothetical protein